MNKYRRAELRVILEKIKKLKDDFESCKDEEQEAFDNLTYGLQCTDRGLDMEDNVNTMELVLNMFDEIIKEINNIVR